MKLPIHVETKGSYHDLCGDNCPFLGDEGIDGRFCILFAEHLTDVRPQASYEPMYERITRCMVFDPDRGE